MPRRGGQLVIRITGDTKDLTIALDQTEKALGKVGGRASKMGSLIAKGMAVGVAGLGAAAGALVVTTAKSLANIQRIGAQTDAAIKSTGGAAERTRGQIDSLATRIEKMSGIEAETVTQGQNMLLTFTNIKGTNFDRATQTMTDMAVAMNGGSLAGLDLKTTAIQVGKALNDPIKGITALKKVGVTFTDQQRAQIKAMTDVGDVAGAQAVIMDELAKEFGGSAAAAGSTVEGTWAKIKNAFGDVSESVLAGLLPAMQKIGAWLIGKGIPAFHAFADWVGRNVVPAIRDLYEKFNANILPALRTFGGFLVGTVIPAIVTLAKWIVQNKDSLFLLGTAIAAGVVAWKAYVFVTVTIPAILKAVKAGVIALNAAMKANVVGIVITLIAALVAGLIYFFTKTETGQKIVKVAFAAIHTAIKTVTDWWQNTALPVIKTGWEIITATFRIGKERVTGFLQSIWNVIKTVWSYSPLGFIITNWNAIFSAISGVWNGKIKPVFNAVKTFITQTIPNAFRTGVDAITRIWNTLKNVAMTPVRFVVNTVWNNGLRKMINAIPGVPDIAPIRLGFAAGGAVHGGVRGRDSVPALMMPGEHVWTAEEVRKAGGHQAMLAMREAAVKGNLNGDPVRKFAEGGSLSAKDIDRAKRWAQSQEGKPYRWGSTGPLGYDCSGFMSAITNVLRDKYTHARVGSTAGFPWAGFRPGPGAFTIGSTANYRGSGVGHMAGTLAGLNVESRGGRGVIVGRGALGATHSGFNEMAHLGADGLDAMKNGGPDWLAAIRAVLDTLRKLPGQISQVLAQGGWITPLMGQMSRELWKNIAGFLNDKIPNIWPLPDNPIPQRFARGGIVRHRPGGTHALIGEGGYDEAVVPLGGPYAGGQRVVLEIRSSGAAVDEMLVELLRRAVRVRGGNVQTVIGR